MKPLNALKLFHSHFFVWSGNCFVCCQTPFSTMRSFSFFNFSSTMERWVVEIARWKPSFSVVMLVQNPLFVFLLCVHKSQTIEKLSECIDNNNARIPKCLLFLLLSVPLRLLLLPYVRREGEEGIFYISSWHVMQRELNKSFRHSERKFFIYEHPFVGCVGQNAFV